jgi:CRP-like cAMP-binding protein
MSRASDRRTDAQVVGFADVPQDIIAHCQRLGRQMSVQRGVALTRQGDVARRCYYVCSGYAKVHSTSPAGRQVLVGFVGPSNIIGHSAAAEWGERYLATTTAADPMVLICWTRDTALELASRYPRIHARLDALVARNLQLVLNRLHTVSEGRGPQRLAIVLLELATRHGQPEPGGHGFAIRPTVTREDLASLTGMSVYTASRVLSAWESRGLIASRRGRIRLTNLPRLRAIARTP